MNMSSSPNISLSDTRQQSTWLGKQAAVDAKLPSGFVLPLIICNCMVSLVASTLNCLVILTFARTSSLHRTPSNILLLALAVSDFAVATISQPLFCVWHYGIRNETMLIAFRVTFDTFVATSLFALTAITTDRFLAIHLHLRYQDVVTSQRYRFVIAGCWLCSIILCVFRYLTKFQAMCVDIIVFSIILSVNIVSFIKIYQAIRRHKRQIQATRVNIRQAEEFLNMKKYKKTVRNMYSIIAAPGLSYVPFLGVLVGYVLYSDVRSRPVFAYYSAISASIAMLSGAINPFIYWIRIEEIRRAFLKMLQNYLFCCLSKLEQNDVPNIERKKQKES